jgi:hypothetical protein
MNTGDNERAPDHPPTVMITVLVAIALQVLVGGMRFVDGSILLQFSRFGFHAHLQDFSQYLFDSQLKVIFYTFFISILRLV